MLALCRCGSFIPGCLFKFYSLEGSLKRLQKTSPMAQAVLNAMTDVVEIKNVPLAQSVNIPRIGLGVFQASPSETESAVLAALQDGYRHIDTAALYRNEASVGRAIKKSGIPRSEIFVTTKLWNSDHGFEKALGAFDRSLVQLGLDYVDLYLIHSPMPVQRRLDSWRAMEEILKSGRARSIGVSNYGVHHLQELFRNCSVKPSVNQIELHPWLQRRDLVQFCESQGIVLEAYSPLTKGLKLKDPLLLKIATKYRKSTAQVLIKWCLQKGFVTLPKSVTPSRIASNIQVYDFEISKEDMLHLDSCDEYLVTGWDPVPGP